jgi:hypothetical protein
LTFWDHPDPRRAIAKAVWLQRRALMVDAVRACLTEFPIGQPAVTVIGDDERLARALSLDLGVPVTQVIDGRPMPSHVVVAELDPTEGHQERVDLLSRALSWVRPAGKCVLVATVVAPPGPTRGRVPSLGQVVRELGLAWRECYHVGDVRSVRWLTEPFVRGVVLTITSLDVPREPQ